MSAVPDIAVVAGGRTYEQVMDQIVQAFRLFKIAGPAILTEAEVDKARRTASASEAFGPIFHPSEWIAAGDSLERQRKVLDLYRHVARELDEIFPADGEAPE